MCYTILQMMQNTFFDSSDYVQDLEKKNFIHFNYLQVYCPCKSTTVFEFTNLQSG